MPQLAATLRWTTHAASGIESCSSLTGDILGGSMWDGRYLGKFVETEV